MQITCCNFLQESKKWSEMNVAHTHTCIPHTHTHSGRQAHTHAANVFAPSGNKNKFEKLILNVLHWKHIVWQPPTLRHLFTLTLSLLFCLSLTLSLSLVLFLSLCWLPLCTSLASLALIFHMPSRQPGEAFVPLPSALHLSLPPHAPTH